MAEATEKRKDAKTAREYELALPAELDAGERKVLAQNFVSELVKRYGVAADVALHAPGQEGDNRNHHAHILTTTRTADANGLGAKTRVLDVASTASVEIEHLRALWASQVNTALERKGVSARVDHRSYARQGIEQEPTQHMGPSATAMERQNRRLHPESASPVSERGKANEAVQKSNDFFKKVASSVERSEKVLADLRNRGHKALNVLRSIVRGQHKENSLVHSIFSHEQAHHPKQASSDYWGKQIIEGMKHRKEEKKKVEHEIKPTTKP